MRFIFPLVIFIGIVYFLAVGLKTDPNIVPSPLIGKPAPEFELPILQEPGQTVNSKTWAGEPYALNVWGSWCPECYNEHEILLTIAKQQQVRLIGLNWKDQREDAIRWLDSLGDPYMINVFDQIGNVAIDWGVYGAPETFLVSADGIVLYKHIGPLTMEIWKKEFIERLSAK